MRNIYIIIALFLLQSVSAQVPEDNYLQAKVLMLDEKYESALNHLNSAIAVSPSDIELVFLRGMCYFELKMYDSATSDFLLVNKRRRGKGSFMLAKIEARLNHPELAVKHLRESLNSSYKPAEKDLLLDKDLNLLESSAAWNALWKEREWYSSYDTDLQESLYLKSTGNNLEAINILLELDKKGFKKTLVNFHLAEIYLLTGNEKAALEALERSINANYRNTEALKMRIDLQFKREDYQKAALDCKQLLRIAPEEFDYYLTSARVENRLGNYESALEMVDIYLRYYPNSPVAYNELGEIHFYNGKYIKAISAFNKTLELDSNNARYYYNRAKTYAATRTFKYAERDYSMSLDLMPTDADTWYYKGLTDEALGKIETACFDFRKAFQYGKFEAGEQIKRLCGN